MGLRGRIDKIVSDFQGAGQSYSQGQNWAEAVIKKSKEAPLAYEVDEQAVQETAEEYARMPYLVVHHCSQKK